MIYMDKKTDKYPVRIRELSKRDIKESVKIINKTLGKHSADLALEDLHLMLKPVSRHRFQKGEKVRLNDTSYTFTRTRVAVNKKNRVVGLGGIYRLDTHPNKVVGIDWFAIDPRYQNMGVGSRFIKWMIKEAKRRNNRVLFVWEARSAEPFYKRFGFRRSNMNIGPRESSVLLIKHI